MNIIKRISIILIVILIILCVVSPLNKKETSLIINQSEKPPTVEEKTEIYKKMLRDKVITKAQIKDDEVVNFFKQEEYAKIRAERYYRIYLEEKMKRDAERQRDIIYIAKTIWGEIRGGSYEEKCQVAWCILNRVDSSRFPDTVGGVVTQSGQFHGYSSSFPVTDDCYAAAEDVYDRWQDEKKGVDVVRELPQNYCFFNGDGVHNYFRING